VGIFTDGVLSPAADVIDRASNGAIRAVMKSEFTGAANSTLVLRDLSGVAAQRILLVGLGKQAEYSARVHAAAEKAFTSACISARVAEATSTLAAMACPGTTATDRARDAAAAVSDATYHYDATFGKPNPDARPKLKKFSLLVARSDSAATALGLKQGAALGEGVSMARTLGNLPGNICTPTYLGETAKNWGVNSKVSKSRFWMANKFQRSAWDLFFPYPKVLISHHDLS